MWIASPPKILCFGNSLSNQSSFNARNSQMLFDHFSSSSDFFWEITCWTESIFCVPQTFAQSHEYTETFLHFIFWDRIKYPTILQNFCRFIKFVEIVAMNARRQFIFFLFTFMLQRGTWWQQRFDKSTAEKFPILDFRWSNKKPNNEHKRERAIDVDLSHRCNR